MDNTLCSPNRHEANRVVLSVVANLGFPIPLSEPQTTLCLTIMEVDDRERLPSYVQFHACCPAILLKRPPKSQFHACCPRIHGRVGLSDWFLRSTRPPWQCPPAAQPPLATQSRPCPAERMSLSRKPCGSAIRNSHNVCPLVVLLQSFDCTLIFQTAPNKGALKIHVERKDSTVFSSTCSSSPRLCSRLKLERGSPLRVMTSQLTPHPKPWNESVSVHVRGRFLRWLRLSSSSIPIY